MPQPVLCGRCGTVAVSRSVRYCAPCKAAIVAQAHEIVARWPSEEGRCRLCGWRFATPGHGTRDGRQLYCSEAHFQIFGVARLLAQGSSFGLWRDEAYQAWLTAPEHPIPADILLPPPSAPVVPRAVPRQEHLAADLAVGTKTCNGWEGIHDPLTLPLVFFAQIGDTYCKICEQAYQRWYRTQHREEEAAQKRARYWQHRDHVLQEARARYEATYIERHEQRQAQLAQVMATKTAGQQQQIKCAHGVCTTPGQCGQQCASLLGHLQKIGNAIQRGLHALAAEGFHPCNNVAVGYRGVEVPLAFRPNGEKRQGNKPRYGVRLVKDEEVAERVQLAWDLRLNGARYKEIHERCQLYEVTTTSKGAYSAYYVLFKNSLYAGILQFGGIWYPLDWESGGRFCDPYITLEDFQNLERQRASAPPAPHFAEGKAGDLVHLLLWVICYTSHN